MNFETLVWIGLLFGAVTASQVIRNIFKLKKGEPLENNFGANLVRLYFKKDKK